MSLLNVDTRISASIKEASYFGTVHWDGHSYQYLKLSDIPTHANISVGDEVITSGYSTIFPRGIKIGTIHSFEISKDAAFYNIYVLPSAKFTHLDHVYILKSNFTTDILSLASDE
jgi:Cell shape-determining protein